MNPTIAPDQPTPYRFLIRGHLSPGWARWFGELVITAGRDDDGRPITTLSGMVQDQAELHGIIGRIRDLGLPLLLVEQDNVTPLETTDESTDDRD